MPALIRPALCGFALLLIALPAAASSEEITLAEVGSGALLLPGAQAGRYRPAPRQHSEALIRVTGPIARTRLTQVFENPSDRWTEALYAFPLPENAAVDRLRMLIGERIVEGEIRERSDARASYETARATGQRAALVEQQRPNLFTTAVANIPPGGTITVRIEYQQALRWRDGEFSLRFPLAITPRYSPEAAAPPATLDGGWAILPGELPNSAALSQATAAEPALLNPVSLRVELRPGFPLRRLESRYHPVDISEQDGAQIVELAATPATRDFELVWAPQAGNQPQAAYFTESTPQGDYALLMLMPPAEDRAAQTAPPRELLFVIDTSGSMGGASIRQARAALTLALQRLAPGDSFNIIRFSSQAEALFSAPVPADAAHRDQALTWVAGLEAAGGTEMRPALDLAFAQAAGASGRLRQIVFITDGAISNEAELFAAIERGLGDARLFTVGIGSAPNTHFMTAAARHGRGSHTLIGSPDEVRERMLQLFTRLENPALTDIALELPVAAETAPDPLPDLYPGEPLSIVMRLAAPPDHARLTGRIGGRAWSQDLTLGPGQEQAGLGVLWARRKIADWQHASSRGVAAADIRAAVLDLALTHHLVSPYTSLVAVDRTPVRPPDQTADSHALESDLPAGWEPGRTLDELPLARGATPSLLLMLLGGALALGAVLLRRPGRVH